MKRTQILIEPEDWNVLSSIAKKQKASIGGLIRYAIKKTYIENEAQLKRTAALDILFKTRHVVTNIDYKDLIEDGRKF